MKPCRLWTGATNDNGYGVVTRHQKQYYVHRDAYEATQGKIPPGMEVRHSCDTPACYESEHLLLGTHADNMRDMRERGRHRWGERPKGEAHESAILTEGQVLSIRSDDRSSRKIAAEYGISKSQVLNIRARRSWAHL